MMTSDQIWKSIKSANKVFVVAELGKNFIQTEEERSVGEYLENAKKLVKAAFDAGADAVKFQTHNVEDEQLDVEIVAPHFSGERRKWVTRNTLATPVDKFWKPLKAYCDKFGIVFFSTPMSRGAAKILDSVGVNLWKVASSDLLDFPLLDYMRQSGKPIILSSGMSTLDEIDLAIDFLNKKTDRIVLLHCVSKYPCPPEELNLSTINFLKSRYNIPIGFSDHSIGIDSALVAVALGAKVVEKHFSFTRNLWGSDHKVSMTPEEMKNMVSEIRIIESNPGKKEAYLNKEVVKRGMGMAGKILQEDEAKFRPVFRKSLMAGRDIPAGTALTADMIYAMRPQAYAGGLPSEHYELVVGQKTARPLKKYDPITESVLV